MLFSIDWNHLEKSRDKGELVYRYINAYSLR